MSWCMVHAPDGNADAAFQRAWETETNLDLLYEIVECYFDEDDSIIGTLTRCRVFENVDYFRETVPRRPFLELRLE